MLNVILTVLVVLFLLRIAIRMISFSIAAIYYFRNKKYMNGKYTPDERDIAAKQNHEFVY